MFGHGNFDYVNLWLYSIRPYGLLHFNSFWRKGGVNPFTNYPTIESLPRALETLIRLKNLLCSVYKRDIDTSEHVAWMEIACK